MKKVCLAELTAVEAGKFNFGSVSGLIGYSKIFGIVNTKTSYLSITGAGSTEISIPIETIDETRFQFFIGTNSSSKPDLIINIPGLFSLSDTLGDFKLAKLEKL